MKKILVLPLFLLVAAANAQLTFGLKAGINVSNFVGGDFQDYETNALTSFHAGGLLHWKFGSLVLQPEVLFSNQGAKLSKGGTDSTFKISYIIIPVMLKYEMEGGLYLEGGPQFGLKISEENPNPNIDNFAKDGDLSIGLGIGVHKSNFGIGGRYVIGISKVGDFDAANIDPDFKNGVIQVSLFYTFFGKKK